jgi:RHS repeat-associated protein
MEVLYDGLRRRNRVVETQANVVQSDITTLWCENAVCRTTDTPSASSTQLFAMGEKVGDSARYFAGDHLRTVRDVTDAAATVQARYAFDPWGRRTLSVGADLTAVGFTGHTWAASSQLWQTHYRPYDPSLGRWLAEDPLGPGGGLNLYGYVRQSPLVYRDPDGLSAVAAGQGGPAQGDNGLAGDIQQLRNIFPDSAWDPGGNSLVVHIPCRRLIHLLRAQGYQDSNSWGYNGPGSAFWNPIGHAGGMEWRTYGPGFHFRMQYPSSCGGDPDCTLDQFHVDKYNPIEPGQFWRHIQCDFLHLCGQ